MITVEQRAAGRDNNFNLLRMIAASAVLMSHAWPIAIGKDAVEPLLTSTGYKLGTTSVTIFFAVSGFFITKSFDRRASAADFVVARVARIYPALVVVLLLTALLLGPLLTSLPIHVYAVDRHSWTYVPQNLLLRHPQWSLPGVFAHNPAGSAINGSLWTLYSEVFCYGLVMLAGWLRLIRPLTFPLILLAAVAPVFLVPQSEAGGMLASTSILNLPFALGAAAYIYRRYLPVSTALTLSLAGAAAATLGTTFYPLMHAVALSYGALWFGLTRFPRLHTYNRLGDFSYGMYIYAFPIEQMWVARFGPMPPLQLALLSFGPTLLLAILSWKLIEAPALARRHVLFGLWRLRRIKAGEGAS